MPDPHVLLGVLDSDTGIQFNLTTKCFGATKICFNTLESFLGNVLISGLHDNKVTNKSLGVQISPSYT